jgi:hypothetical protein
MPVNSESKNAKVQLRNAKQEIQHSAVSGQPGKTNLVVVVFCSSLTA